MLRAILELLRDSEWLLKATLMLRAARCLVNIWLKIIGSLVNGGLAKIWANKWLNNNWWLKIIGRING